MPSPRTIARLALLLAAALIAACDASDRYVGTWSVDKSAMRAAMQEGAAATREEFGPIGESIARKMSEQLIASLEMTLEIDPGGTWTMTGAMMGNDIVRTGRWSLREGEMVMTSDAGVEVHARVEEGRLWVDREREDLRLAFVRAER